MSGVGYFAGSTLAGAWGGESPHSNSFVCSEYMAGCGGTSLGKQRYQIGMFFDESIHSLPYQPIYKGLATRPPNTEIPRAGATKEENPCRSTGRDEQRNQEQL